MPITGVPDLCRCGYERVPGVSANAPLISIRKFPPDVYTDEQCIQYGNISPEMAEFLHFIVPKGANLVIGGEPIAVRPLN